MAFLADAWSENSMNAFPLLLPPPMRSLHFVISPNGEKNWLRVSSVVSKLRPWTNSSVFPSCSSFVSSAFSTFISESALDCFLLFFTGLASELSLSESLLLEELSCLAAFFDFLTGAFSSLELDPSESESLDEDDCCFLLFFLAGAFFGAGFSSSDDESDPEELEDESFLATFLAGAFFTGFSSSEDESELLDDEEESFLAAFFAGAFLGGSSDEESDSDSDDELTSTFLFF